MPAQDVPVAPPALDRSAVNTALVLILFGGPIVVFDFTISQNGGPAFDIVNDTIGLALILGAVSLLARQPGRAGYSSRIQAVVVLTAVMLVWSILVQLAPTLSFSLIGVMASGLSVLGTILFCTAMRELCAFLGFGRSIDAWRQAVRMVAFLLGGAWLLWFVATIVRAASSGTLLVPQLYFDVGSAAILLLLLGMALVITPLVFILVAIGTTRRELRASETTEAIP